MTPASETAYEDFLNPKSMLTPAGASAVVVLISGALFSAFALSIPIVSIILSFMIGYIVFYSADYRRGSIPAPVKAIIYILNSLIIFAVATGAHSSLAAEAEPPVVENTISLHSAAWMIDPNDAWDIRVSAANGNAIPRAIEQKRPFFYDWLNGDQKLNSPDYVNPVNLNSWFAENGEAFYGEPNIIAQKKSHSLTDEHGNKIHYKSWSLPVLDNQNEEILDATNFPIAWSSADGSRSILFGSQTHSEDQLMGYALTTTWEPIERKGLADVLARFGVLTPEYVVNIALYPLDWDGETGMISKVEMVLPGFGLPQDTLELSSIDSVSGITVKAWKSFPVSTTVYTRDGHINSTNYWIGLSADF